MDKDGFKIVVSVIRRTSLAIGSLCFMASQAATAPLADQDTQLIKSGETWTLTVPDNKPSFLQVQNVGIDTLSSAFDVHENRTSESATWRGPEGRYVLALIDKKGNHAVSVAIQNMERHQNGSVTIKWLYPNTFTRSDRKIRQGLDELAIAGNLHATHANGERAHENAVAAYNDALASLRGTVFDEWKADIEFELGVTYRHMGMLTEARKSNQNSLSAFQALNNTRGMAAANNALGLIALGLGQHDEAISHFNEDLRLRASGVDYFFRARAFNNIATAYWQLDEYQAASNAYMQALRMFTGRNDLSLDQILRLSVEQLATSGDLSEMANTLNNLALARTSLGDVDQAEVFWQKAIRLARSNNDNMRVALSELNLGKMYQQQGRLEPALQNLESALIAYQLLNNNYWVGETLTGLGNVYASIGEHFQALEFYQQTLELNVENQRQRANTLTQMAISNWKLGNIIIADNQFTEAYTSFANSDQPGSAAVVASKHGMLLYEIGQHKQALNNQHHSIQTLTNLDNIREAARARSSLGQLLLSEGQTDQAEAELQTALQGHRAVSDELFELDTLTALSQAQSGIAALDSAKAAIELAGRIRGRASSADIQTSFVASRRSAYERYINLLVDAGEMQQAWLVNEQIRARTLLDLIRQADNSEIHLATNTAPVDIQALQEQLGADTAMLSYYLGEQRSHLWVINQEGISYYALPDAGQINAIASALTQTLRDHRQSPSRIAYIAAQLSDMVLQPAKDSIGERQLVVVADGDLQLIPFGLLPLETTQSSETLLMANNNVTYIPSAQIFNRLGKQTIMPTDNILVLADPLVGNQDQSQSAFAGTDIEFSNLMAQRSIAQSGVNIDKLPGARLEAAAIKAMAHSSQHINATLKIGAQASHEFVTNGALGDYDVIHFATHGIVDADVPGLSGLMMSPDTAQSPRYLRPQEIAGLQLNAGLVVLSGCETGIGKSIAGEGLMSLSRPFLIAGVQQVISSLWKVSDRATAQLMERFYFHLLQQNQAPEQALQSAQQWMRQHSQWQHPNYWAGFVLQGTRITQS